jgi:hypothetical protein
MLVGSFATVAICGYEVGHLQENATVGVVIKEGRLYQEQAQKLQEELTKCENKPQEHNYSTFQQGLTRWRFDAVDGSTCVMLTTAENWKHPETKRENCACSDPAADYNSLKARGCYAGLDLGVSETPKKAK